MDAKGFNKLNIDEEFKALIPPLKREEYQQLERNLILEGCREPIITWHGTIVDGHNRYELCTRLKIPYAVVDREFETRESVIVWICTNQLGRRNISEETFKYLIGKQYETEKRMGFPRNLSGLNQHTKPARLPAKESPRRTATRIGEEHRLASGTVQKYAKYTQALDSISQQAPELAEQILCGNYKISHDNTVALSHMDSNAIQELSRKVERNPRSFIRYSESHNDITGEKPMKLTTETPAIKTMPTFDPDAEIVGLSLTIPSWVGSINRTQATADFSKISPTAKLQLKVALSELYESVTVMLDLVKGDYNV